MKQSPGEIIRIALPDIAAIYGVTFAPDEIERIAIEADADAVLQRNREMSREAYAAVVEDFLRPHFVAARAAQLPLN